MNERAREKKPRLLPTRETTDDALEERFARIVCRRCEIHNLKDRVNLRVDVIDLFLKTLLEKLNFQISEYKLNQHFSARGFAEEFGKDAEYPQVNVGFRHIGGLKDTLQYMKDHGMFA